DAVDGAGAAGWIRAGGCVLGLRCACPGARDARHLRVRGVPRAGPRAGGVHRRGGGPGPLRVMRLRPAPRHADAAGLLRADVRPALVRRVDRVGVPLHGQGRHLRRGAARPGGARARGGADAAGPGGARGPLHPPGRARGVARRGRGAEPAHLRLRRPRHGAPRAPRRPARPGGRGTPLRRGDADGRAGAHPRAGGGAPSRAAGGRAGRVGGGKGAPRPQPAAQGAAARPAAPRLPPHGGRQPGPRVALYPARAGDRAGAGGIRGRAGASGRA
ncbi:MAG: hypothetical protein AVDCRST_MAG89-250, partial [uncultured Gemmatimonadetes bacterium]